MVVWQALHLVSLLILPALSPTAFLKVVNGSLLMFLFCDFHRTVEIGTRSIFLWKIRPCCCSNAFQLSIPPITVPGGLIGSCLTQSHLYNFIPSSSVHVCLHQLPLSWIFLKPPPRVLVQLSLFLHFCSHGYQGMPWAGDGSIKESCPL